MKKQHTFLRFTLLLCAVVTISLTAGCGMFSKPSNGSTTTTLNLKATPNSNQGKNFSILVIPSTQQHYLTADYATVYHQLFHKGTQQIFVSFPEQKTIKLSKTVTIPNHGGIAIYCMFSKTDQQHWKTYLAHPQDKSFDLTVNQNGITMT